MASVIIFDLAMGHNFLLCIYFRKQTSMNFLGGGGSKYVDPECSRIVQVDI